MERSLGAPRRAASAPAARADSAVARLFRKEALEAHEGAPREKGELALPTPGGWAILTIISSLVLVALAGALLGSIEVTVRAPGVLRAPEGLKAVETQLSGSVSEVLVEPGEHVASGQVLVRLEAAQLEASLARQQQELELLRSEAAREVAADERLKERTTRALARRRALLLRQSKITHAQERQRSKALGRLEDLVAAGAAALVQAEGARESLQESRRQSHGLASEVASIDLQLAELTNRLEARSLEREKSLARSVARIEETRAMLRHTVVEARAEGRVESILVSVGSVVAQGQKLAQVVPSGALQSIVAFLPSAETAFIARGAKAKVELHSLPRSEFGTADAFVKRVSSDTADPQELSTAFGEVPAGAFVRVELELSVAGHEEMKPHLRSGERVTVRLHRRERRIIHLLFDFTRELIDS